MGISGLGLFFPERKIVGVGWTLDEKVKNSGSQRVYSRPEASASLGKLSKDKLSGPILDIWNEKVWGWASSSADDSEVQKSLRAAGPECGWSLKEVIQLWKCMT